MYFNLFVSFFKIGLFGFGGGYAMLSLIQHEVVETHNWISVGDFTDIVAISQMTPGPIGINMATYVGYTVTGNAFGSFFATLALCLPSFIIMLTIAHYYIKFRQNKYIEDVFLGLRIVIVGLIAAAGLQLMNKDNFIDYISVILFLLAFLAVWKMKANPIMVILIAGVAGFLIY